MPQGVANVADAWRPANELERRLQDTLLVGDTAGYFRLLAEAELLVPVPPDLLDDVLANESQPTWPTQEQDGRTYVLAFTSTAAMRTGIGPNYQHFVKLKFAEAAETWPDPRWWLTLNLGAPIEGRLPSWFVAQLAQGDPKPPQAGLPGAFDRAHPPAEAQPPHGAAAHGTAAHDAAAHGPSVYGELARGEPTAAEPARGEHGYPAGGQAGSGQPPVAHDHTAPGRAADDYAARHTSPGTRGYVPPAGESGGVGARGFQPANEVERELLRAAGLGDQDAYFKALVSTEVLLLVPDEMDYTRRPGRPGFPWQTREVDGGTVLPVCTSAERVREATDPGRSEYLKVPFGSLLRYWPDRTWGLAVNPRTPVATTVPGEQVRNLSEWADRIAAQRAAENFDPQNDIERRLFDAATRRDQDAFVKVLLSAQVLIAADPETPWGIRPDDPEFPWRPTHVHGSKAVQVFTSLKWMHDAIGSSRFVMPGFMEIASAWPDTGWSLVINPGTPIDATVPGDRVKALGGAPTPTPLTDPTASTPTHATPGSPTTTTHDMPPAAADASGRHTQHGMTDPTAPVETPTASPTPGTPGATPGISGSTPTPGAPSPHGHSGPSSASETTSARETTGSPATSSTTRSGTPDMSGTAHASGGPTPGGPGTPATPGVPGMPSTAARSGAPTPGAPTPGEAATHGTPNAHGRGGPAGTGDTVGVADTSGSTTTPGMSGTAGVPGTPGMADPTDRSCGPTTPRPTPGSADATATPATHGPPTAHGRSGSPDTGEPLGARDTSGSSAISSTTPGMPGTANRSASPTPGPATPTDAATHGVPNAHGRGGPSGTGDTTGVGDTTGDTTTPASPGMPGAVGVPGTPDSAGPGGRSDGSTTPGPTPGSADATATPNASDIPGVAARHGSAPSTATPGSAGSAATHGMPSAHGRSDSPDTGDTTGVRDISDGSATSGTTAPDTATSGVPDVSGAPGSPGLAGHPGVATAYGAPGTTGGGASDTATPYGTSAHEDAAFGTATPPATPEPHETAAHGAAVRGTGPYGTAAHGRRGDEHGGAEHGRPEHGGTEPGGAAHGRGGEYSRAEHGGVGQGAAEPYGAEVEREFEPGNRIDQELFEAAVSGDTDAFLRVLLAANVLVPIPADAPLEVTPIQPEFRWEAAMRDASSVQVFTSLVRLREALPASRFVYADFRELIGAWPRSDWTMLLNPGTRIGASLLGDQVQALSEWAVRVGLIRPRSQPPGLDGEPPVPLREPVSELPAPAADQGRLETYREPAVPQPVVMQKVLPHGHVGWYLEQGYDRVGGFVHPISDVTDLQAPAQLYEALGLLFEGSPFTPSDEGVYVIRWPAYCAELYRIPFGGQTEEDVQGWGDAGWVIERPPFQGSGFAPGSAGSIREYKLDSARLPYGAEMYYLGRDRSERFVAMYDPDRAAWLRPDGDETGAGGSHGERSAADDTGWDERAVANQ